MYMAVIGEGTIYRIGIQDLAAADILVMWHENVNSSTSIEQNEEKGNQDYKTKLPHD